MAEDLELHTHRPVPVMSEREVDQLKRTAQVLAESGFFKDARDGTKAMAKILAGRDLGLSPFEAMSALHVIEGKIEASADLHASRVKASDKYDYRVRHLDTKRCAIDFYDGPVTGDDDDDNWKLGTSEFSMADAEAAGLAKRDVWKKYPRNMLFARAMSNGVAWFCPDVMGGLRVYTEGELDAKPDLTAGEGTTENLTQSQQVERIMEWAPTEELGLAIAATLVRAQMLGHAGYSHYDSLELELKRQPKAYVEGWVQRANQHLDEMSDDKAKPSMLEEGDVVDIPAAEAMANLTAEDIERQALEKLDLADAADTEEGAEALRAEAEALRDTAKQMEFE